LLLQTGLEAGRLNRGPAQHEVVPPRTGEQGHERGHCPEHPPEEPARAPHVEHAAPTAVHQDQGEAAARPAHERLSGITAASGLGMRQRPSNLPPSSSTRTGASMSPWTRALLVSSMRSLE